MNVIAMTLTWTIGSWVALIPCRHHERFYRRKSKWLARWRALFMLLSSPLHAAFAVKGLHSYQRTRRRKHSPPIVVSTARVPQSTGFACERGAQSRAALVDGGEGIKELISASVQTLQNDSALAGEAGKTMSDVTQAVARVTDIMGEIAAASAEQSRGIDQVNLTITQMDATTQQNAALVEQRRPRRNRSRRRAASCRRRCPRSACRPAKLRRRRMRARGRPATRRTGRRLPRNAIACRARHDARPRDSRGRLRIARGVRRSLRMRTRLAIRFTGSRHASSRSHRRGAPQTIRAIPIDIAGVTDDPRFPAPAIPALFPPLPLPIRPPPPCAIFGPARPTPALTPIAPDARPP